MTMVISGGNQQKLERLARELVKGLTVADFGAVVAGTINTAVEERLCSAADVNFPKHERRIRILEKTIDWHLAKTPANCSMSTQSCTLGYPSRTKEPTSPLAMQPQSG